MATIPDTDRRRVALARIAEVRSRFLDGLDERLAALSLLARQSAGPDGAGAWDGLRLGLHNLSGGAPSLGFAELGRHAAELEAIVIRKRQADGRLGADVAARIADDVLALRADAPHE